MKTTVINESLHHEAGLIKKLDYFFVLRPMLFFPGWSTLLAGALIGYKSRLAFDYHTILQLDYTLLTVMLFIFGAAMGMSFLLNQWKDVETDRKNNKLFIISEGHISKNAVVIEILLLGILAIAGGFIVSKVTGILIISFILLTGFLYNFRPFVLKDRPVGSLAANALMGWLAFALGWTLFNPISTAILIDSIPYTLFNTALYLFTILPDVEGDRESSKKTFAVLYGKGKVIYTAFVLYSVSLASCFLLADWQILLVTGCALPFFIRVTIKKDISSVMTATKFSILFFAIMICLKIPFYVILMIGLFFLTRWYFRLRFNFDYPNFKGT